MSDPRPFTGCGRALLVLPSVDKGHPDHTALHHFSTLILNELPELEAEVGCSVSAANVSVVTPGASAILVGPAAHNQALRQWREQEAHIGLPAGPYVAIERQLGRVVIDSPNLDGIGDAFQLLRTAIAERLDLLEPSLCDSADVLARLDTEVRRTFPLFQDRVPGWSEAVDHVRSTVSDPDDLATLQQLMTTLGDAHSWVKDPRINGRLPYHLVHTDGVTRFWDIPEVSLAWEHGIRRGDTLVRPDVGAWWARTASVERTKPWNVGYRAMQGRVGEPIALEAIRSSDSTAVRWTEPIPPLPWISPIEAHRIDAETGYLRIRGWLNSQAWQDAFQQALRDLRTCDHLIIDLRGNVGGALVAAQAARDRFLPGRIMLGSIRFSTVMGTMDCPHALDAEPPEVGPLWTKPVRMLIDPLCYSATEDFLLGLQGLPHVELVGQQTGGGSGRPRTIWLREHMLATISTALTYDRTRRCIEGNGFAPDIEVPVSLDPEEDRVLAVATAGW